MVRKHSRACTGMAQLGCKDMAYGRSPLQVAMCTQQLLREAEVSLLVLERFWVSKHCWKRLEIPATFNGLGCSETPLAWSSSPVDLSLIKRVVLQKDAPTHEGMQGIAVKPVTLFLFLLLLLLLSFLCCSFSLNTNTEQAWFNVELILD